MLRGAAKIRRTAKDSAFRPWRPCGL